jgi:DNA damage-inducible protein 1
MRLHFNIVGRPNIVSLDAPDDGNVDELRALLEVSTGVPVPQQNLSVDNRNVSAMDPSTSLKDAGIRDGDLLSLADNSAAGAAAPPADAVTGGGGGGGGANAGGSTPTARTGPGLAGLSPNLSIDEFAQTVRSDPALLLELRSQNPALADAVANPDPSVLQNLVSAGEARRAAASRERMELERAIMADPLNPELQAKLEKMIHQVNIETNLNSAMEHNPEAFASVVMLYVPAVVNGTEIPAFVDSGAQMTIMSEKTAERCGILRLVDRRYQGVAKGVGEAKIIGRVHMAPIKVGGSFFYSSFTVLEGEGMEFLLGLDFLSKHRACIDLAANPRCLRLGDSEAVPFLQEGDLPHHARGTQKPDAETSAGGGAAAAGSGSSGAGAAAGGGAAGTPHDSEKVAGLLALGAFSEAEVIRALDACQGNAELAAGMLFGGMP